MLRCFDIVFYVKGKGSITVVFRDRGSSVGFFFFHRKHQNLRFSHSLSLSDRFVCFSQDDLEDGLFNLQWELLCLHVVGSKQQLLYATATAGKTVETAPWPKLLLLCAMNLPLATCLSAQTNSDWLRCVVNLSLQHYNCLQTFASLSENDWRLQLSCNWK